MKRLFLTSLLLLFTYQYSYADHTITIKEKAIKKTFALGYRVDGDDYGSMGSEYKGKGPAKENYLFGYKSSAFGSKQYCGEAMLKHDSIVTLHNDKSHCYITVE